MSFVILEQSGRQTVSGDLRLVLFFYRMAAVSFTAVRSSAQPSRVAHNAACLRQCIRSALATSWSDFGQLR
jgi:hypothetical protein